MKIPVCSHSKDIVIISGDTVSRDPKEHVLKMKRIIVNRKPIAAKLRYELSGRRKLDN